jgi:ribosome biogenesis GTPase
MMLKPAQHDWTVAACHSGWRLGIDTAGIRILYISDVSDGIDAFLPTLTELAPLFQSPDCTHVHEPGCAVQAVVRSLTLASDRVERWRSLVSGNRDRTPVKTGPRGARLVATAEGYYRVMYYGGAESWNLRDTHMFETL